MKMMNEMAKIESLPLESPALTTPELAARVLLLGGIGALPDEGLRIGAELAAEFSAQDLRVSALHEGAITSAEWLGQSGIDLVSLAAMQGGEIGALKTALGKANTVGAGETEAFANSPVVICTNGIRLGFLAFSERSAGGFDNRADILGLAVYDHVRMLLSQCDHVIVLVRAGLTEGKLPLPEWRARYRRFIDAGASAVIDTGAAKGWEAYKQGFVFYGLGQPSEGDSLALALTLLQNGHLRYEVRSLECAGGELRFSSDDSFKQQINGLNTILFNDAAYLCAADEMCVKYYEDHEQPHRRGLFDGLFGALGDSARLEEEQRLAALLGDESRRLAILRALRVRRDAAAQRSSI